ncbi:transglutaminase-like domain-containing protein [Streptomyces sp. NRRL B-24484]|uniref:transglutaminase-like domain-containing protein n=1 Tax=Streptomyces sp. NRRL B-24484 TaxID=1463833 RepID=UPI0006946FF1|nr:transglutaminase family protein [Streptomyces sp. NRRL B-24484]
MTTQRNVPETSVPAAGDPAHLAADAIVDHGHPSIRALAGRLRGATAEETARALYLYVRDEVAHSYDVDRWSAAVRASDVLAAGDAVCHGKSHLLVALLRAEGIPAGLCYQRLEALHGLVAYRLPGRSEWVRIDPRGNRPGMDAQFATTPAEERIAYPDVPLEPGVHAAVPPVLAAGLARGVPGVASFDYIPTAL